VDSDGNTSELLLIPEPLHRFQSKKHGVIDGALFAFAEGDDSEALLILRADEKDKTWKFACGRSGYYEMSGRAKGRQVWKVTHVESADATAEPKRYLKAPYISSSDTIANARWVFFDVHPEIDDPLVDQDKDTVKEAKEEMLEEIFED